MTALAQVKEASLTPYISTQNSYLLNPVSLSQKGSDTKIKAVVAFRPYSANQFSGHFSVVKTIKNPTTGREGPEGWSRKHIVGWSTVLKQRYNNQTVLYICHINNNTFVRDNLQSQIEGAGSLLIEAAFVQSIQSDCEGRLTLNAVDSFNFYKKIHFVDDSPQAPNSTEPRDMHLSPKGIKFFKERLLTSPVPHVGYLAEQLAPLAAENPKDTDPRDTAEEIARIVLDYLIASTRKEISLTPYTERNGYVLNNSVSLDQRDSTSKVSAYLTFSPSTTIDDPHSGRFLVTNNVSDCTTWQGYAWGYVIKKQTPDSLATSYEIAQLKNESFDSTTEKSKVVGVGTLFIEAIFAQSIQSGAAGHIIFRAIGSYDFYKKHYFVDDIPQALGSKEPREMHLSDKGIKYFKERLLTSPVPHVSYLAEQLVPLAAENPKDTDPRDTAEEISRIVLDYLI